jgi:hypothetical protein
VSRAKRLGKLEERYAKAERARNIGINIVWTTPGAAPEPMGSGKPRAVRISLTPASAPTPSWLGADALEPEPDSAAPAPPKPRGQRPLPPTQEEREAADAELARRWAAGMWVGSPEFVPAAALSHLRVFRAPTANRPAGGAAGAAARRAGVMASLFDKLRDYR